MGAIHLLRPSQAKKIRSINPATGEELKAYSAATAEEVDTKITRAAEVFRTYRQFTFAQRAELLSGAADILEAEKAHWGRLMALEMGKTIPSGIEEAGKCAWACRFYAQNAATLLAPEFVSTQADESSICYQPVGPVLAVMPWNFPFWQVFRFAAPALMAGNVVLLKHASNVPQCALAIEEIFARAGFPEGVFQTLLIGSDQVTQVIEDPRVRGVTLTGSDEAGSKVASEAGRHLKKVVLELGGSDPFIVMPSAHLDLAVETAVKARIVNNGQSCIAAKRFIIHEAIADAFESRFVKAMSELRVGNPLEAKTQLGPLATPEIRETVARQVEESVQVGARVLTGGKRIEGAGNYYEPTVLTDISPEAPAYHEEVFGPVASLFRVKNLEEALALANDSRYGLGSSFWSTDVSEQTRFVEEIQAGMAFVNGMVASDPRLPFGGIKDSGYGRELSQVGIMEFVNIKTVWIKRGD
jgi:succinate-semialdehyde dehydrogenase/glutarate-semialdehyde dehydrogenase